ncbi:conserved hypothetical protein [Microsporum canis CBS 113480]|uniref:Uncharacterized protein n=1 Tax=Arthroderma otae (strain ATCC MYA-4605 / CBS 113480) TaxID=554155 RepID=C5FYU5_ARTOC|nr:conserved hypothetical protein [Microsporum canis CBS 113480]EEQ34693.1 conserved hypothetical protein [Microsporum canis CBS 113480]
MAYYLPTYPTGNRSLRGGWAYADTNGFRSDDSPMKQGVKESDRLFEMSATAKPEQVIAEFSLKSLLFQGLGKTESRPLPSFIE